MRLNFDRDLVKQLTGQRTASKKTRHVDESTHEPTIWSCDTGQWLSYPVLAVANWPFCECPNTRCGLAKTRLKHPSLPFDSLPYPTLIICRRVRTYVRTYVCSVNHATTKRKEVDHIPWDMGLCTYKQKQEPIKWSLHLPYMPLEPTLSRVDL